MIFLSKKTNQTKPQISLYVYSVLILLIDTFMWK